MQKDNQIQVTGFCDGKIFFCYISLFSMRTVTKQTYTTFHFQTECHTPYKKNKEFR